jgi:tetratricopeptide (TPR) repeat protein
MQGARSVPQRPEGWAPQAALHAAHRQLAATIGRARGLEATHLANVLAHDRPRLQFCAAGLKQAMGVCGGTVAPCMYGCMVFVAGYIHYLLDELSTAASYVREAIKSLPETPPEWLFLAAQILVPLGDGQEAESLLRAAIKGRPRYLAAHLELMTLLSDAGDLAGCYAVAKAAATLDPPLHWTDGWQRPDHVVPSLRAFPWHDPATIDWCSTLEAQATFIKEELMSVWPQTSDAPTTSGWTDVGHGQDELSDSRLVAPLVDDRPASWREFVLLGGPGFEAQEAAAARQCPRTVTILRSIPAVASLADAGLGEAIFSTLAPGTWLRPHCGGTNARLTCHL